MANYKRTIITEDGSKMEITDPSLTENITVYTIQDESEKRGFYLLNESDKVIADDFLIALKLAYISYDDTLNDTSKDEIYNETIQQVNELADDANTRKYLKKKIDVLFQTSITFDDIKNDLDTYSTDEVIIIIKEYITETAEDKKEKTTEIKKWLVEYLAKRKTEEQPTEMLENKAVEEENSFVEEQPTSTGFLGFLKEIGTAFAEKAIDVLQYAESCKGDIEVYREKCSAWQKRGMDLRYYNSVSREQQIKYLRSFGIDTKEKYERFEEEIEEEIYN